MLNSKIFNWWIPKTYNPWIILQSVAILLKQPVSEFNEFEPRLKFAKNRFQLSDSLNLEKLNTILSGTNQLETRLKFKPRLKFFKFGLRVFISEVITKFFKLTRSPSSEIKPTPWSPQTHSTSKLFNPINPIPAGSKAVEIFRLLLNNQSLNPGF